MNRTLLGRIATTSLVLGLATVACTPHAGMGPQSAGSQKPPRAAVMAGKQADKARDALAHNKALVAVAAAENAVALAPQDASHRMLLGQSYLAAGRFASAETAFRDSLTLSPDQPKAKFDLALAEVAQGRGGAAQSLLKTIGDTIPATDLGLALTLAGDHEAGIAMLVGAVRRQDATPRTRQNLALAYALDGHWREAQAVAMQDTPSGQLTERLAGWAAMAGPDGGARQVAAMLGVSPVADPGLPTRLALATPPAGDAAPTALAAADPLPAAPAPEAAAPVPAALASADQAAPIAPAAEVALSSAPAVTPALLAQAPLPAPATPVALAAMPSPASAPLLRAPRSPIRTAVAYAPKPSAMGGEFVVQLGAFRRTGAVEIAWNQVSRKAPALAAYSPAQARFQLAGASLSRLSISGFRSHDDAAKLCEAVKARGGDCFVRQTAGDAPLEWVHRDTAVQVASR